MRPVAFMFTLGDHATPPSESGGPAILGACHPSLAKQALEGDSRIGLLLPCNVVVQEDGEGGTTVSIADPKAMFTLVDNADVAPVAEQAEQKLRRALDALAGQ